MNEVKWVEVISDPCEGTIILLWFSTIPLRGFVMSFMLLMDPYSLPVGMGCCLHALLMDATDGRGRVIEDELYALNGYIHSPYLLG
jgi:hypothetical protein